MTAFRHLISASQELVFTIFIVSSFIERLFDVKLYRWLWVSLNDGDPEFRFGLWCCDDDANLGANLLSDSHSDSLSANPFNYGSDRGCDWMRTFHLSFPFN